MAAALQAIEDAREALATQAELVKTESLTHISKWEAWNLAKDLAWTSRISALQAMCGMQASPPLSLQAAEDPSEIQLLRKQMESMQSQILLQASTHADLVSENNSRFESALEKWKVHCAELKSQLKEDANLTTLSPSETELRKAHAVNTKGAALTAVAESAPSGAVKAAQVVDVAGANY